MSLVHVKYTMVYIYLANWKPHPAKKRHATLHCNVTSCDFQLFFHMKITSENYYSTFSMPYFNPSDFCVVLYHCSSLIPDGLKK